MSRLALSFLGPPRVLLDDTPVEMRRRKPMALLAYLAVAAQTHSRDALTEMLYPGHDREQGSSDFRQALAALRRAIGESWLVADRTGVRLRDGKDLWIDVMDFRRLIEAAKSREKVGEPAGGEKSICQAAALVRGTFLAGFFLRDSPEFEDWQSAEGESLRRDQAWVLERLVELHQSREEYQEAIEPCRRWMSLEPFDEAIHRRLMQLCALSGQRSLALKQYDRCRNVLAKELGAKPSRETEELRDQIARGSFQPRKPRKPADPMADSTARPEPFSIPFVGRERELERLKAAQEQARGGMGRVAMLVGEAGIGKTRLLEEAAAHALSAGARVIWGRCYEDAGRPPLWPWRQALGQLVRESRADAVRRWAGSRAAVLGGLLEEVCDKLGAQAAPVRLDDPASEGFRTAEAVEYLLVAASEEQPLVIVIDDLQCADSAALRLLEFVSRGLGSSRILLLAACRSMEADPGHPLGLTLGTLARERYFERIEVGALGREEVAEMAARAIGGALPSGFGDALWERTRGNPLYVVESLRFRRVEMARQEEHAEATSRELPIPPNVLDLIRRQMHGVSRGCHELLETAAALGAEFSVEVLRRVTKLSGPWLLESLDEAMRSRFLSERPGDPESLRFSHPLIQEAISKELTHSRRAELHANIARELEESYGAERERHATELARHFALAQPLAPAEKLTRYELLAGEQALRDNSYGEALGHFQRGLAAKGPGADDAETAWLRFGLARALFPVADINYLAESRQASADAFCALSRAFDFFVRAGDTESSVRIAEHPTLFCDTPYRGSIALIDKALTLVEPGSIDAVRLLRLRAVSNYSLDGDYPAASKLLQEALEVATRHKDRQLALRVAGSWVTVSAAELEPREVAMERVRYALELLREIDDPAAGFIVRLRAYHGELGAGNLPAAETHLEALSAAAARLRSAFHLKLALMAKLELAWIQGDWAAARDASDQALAEIGDLQAHLDHLGVRARMEFELGAVEEGTRYLDRYLAHLRRVGFGPDANSASAVIALAQIFQLTGDTALLDLARSAAGSAIELGHDGERKDRPLHMLVVRMGLALVAAMQGDRETAKRMRCWLASIKGIWIPGLRPTKSRLLGMLDVTLGDAEAAVQELEQALGDYEAQRPGPNYAWTTSQLAEALLARGRQGDRKRAAALLRDSLVMATSLGMVPLQQRCRRMAARAPAAAAG